MKKALLPITLIFLLSIFNYSCSSDDDDSAVSSVIQTPTPEPEETTTQYTLTVSAGDGGSVSSEGGTYDEGTKVTVTASPNEGYRFIGWESSNSKSESLTVTLNSSQSYHALFEYILGNYGTPFYTLINNTTGTSVSNAESSGRFISRKEAVERINIDNGDSGTYILGDQAQALFDYDSDGDLDFFGWLVNITPATSKGYVSGPGKWVWWPNYEDENSTPKYYDSPLWFAAQYEMNDFNGDGILDLLWQNENYHSDGNGGYYTDHYPLLITYLSENGITETTIGPPTGAHDTASGDIDNDGDIDIIEAEWQYGSCDHISVPTFYINDGNGNFTTSKNNLSESLTFLESNSCRDMVFTYISLFDMNNDGFLDVISGYTSNQDIQNYSSEDQNLFSLTNYSPNHIKVWYGDGSGNFSLKKGFRITLTTPTQPKGVGASPATVLGANFMDFDNDSFPELVTTETYNYSGWGIRVYKNIEGTGFEDVTSNYIQDPIQLHSGASGAFAPQQPGDVGISYDLQIIDIDNDGDYDIMPSYPSNEDNASTVKTTYFENVGGSYSLRKTSN